jgi:NADH-quinone oxidoreductase subunit L
MNTAVSHYFWSPLKSVGRVFAFLDTLPAQMVSVAFFLAALGIVASGTVSVRSKLVISTTAAVVSIVFYIRAYATKNAARTCWNLIMLGHLFGALFLGLASSANWKYLGMYGVGVAVAFVAGHVCLWYLELRGQPTTLGNYHGSIYVFKKLGHIFFIVCLLLMAFPISPSFLAQDILLSFIPGSHAFQIVLFCVAYLIMGVSIMRLYTKVFFGPHKTSNEIAYRSS